MANLALTTTFQPPASCFDNVYTSLGGGVYEKDVSITSSECYPSSFRAIFSETIPYSPGVCPSGYDYDSVTPYGVGATAALCCPLGMTAYESGLGCNSQVSGATELYVDGSTITVDDQAVLAVHGVYVAWASNELPPAETANAATSTRSTSSIILTSDPATESSDSVASSTRSADPQSSASSSVALSASSTSAGRSSSGSPTALTLFTTDADPSKSTSSAPASSTARTDPPSALSNGAKAGIGVGVSVGALAIVGAAAWLLIARRKRHRGALDDFYSQPEMYQEERDSAAENKAHHISELSTEGARSELSGPPHLKSGQSGGARAELDS